MAFIRFYTEFGGTDRQLIRRLQNVQSKLSDFREQNETVYREFWVPKMKRQFASQGADSGDRWEALNAQYAEQKRKRYGAKTINRRTDRIYNSLVGQTADTVKDVDRYTATFGSTVPYFQFVQNMRRIVNVTARDKRDIGNLFRRDLEKVVRREGF